MSVFTLLVVFMSECLVVFVFCFFLTKVNIGNFIFCCKLPFRYLRKAQVSMKSEVLLSILFNVNLSTAANGT